MKIYCKYNIFWIKWAKVLKLILSSDIAFSRKTICRNLSLGPHGGFSWDKVQIVPNLCSYVLCKSTFFMAKTDFFCKNFVNFFEFLGFLAWNRYLHIKTLKLQLLAP